MQKTVYADNAATTRVSQTALDAMLPCFTIDYGNPSGFYALSRNAKVLLEKAREDIANCIGAESGEIYFTAGGSESDNWALKGVAALLGNKKGKHIITTKIEHHAILYTAQYLEGQGFEVTYLSVDKDGMISLDELKSAIRDDTILISVMAANNEIGTIQPIAEIGKIAHEHGILFHTDAVQAVGHIPINVKEMNIDMLSMASHKFNGPKGAGALYVKNTIKLPALIIGGGQEKKRRGGTENVAGYVGMAAALKEAISEMSEEALRLTHLRDKLISGVLEKIPYSFLTGHPAKRLPGTASFIFECVEGESLVLMLDYNGICASSGSACSSGSLDPSHVLLAIGLVHEQAHGSLRLSLGKYNTEEDVDYILEKLPDIVARLRDMSPLWEKKVKGEI